MGFFCISCGVWPDSPSSVLQALNQPIKPRAANQHVPRKSVLLLKNPMGVFWFFLRGVAGLAHQAHNPPIKRTISLYQEATFYFL
jgi:hypothetical protein